VKIKNLNSKDSENLCQRREDHFFDRKAFAVRPANLQKAATAFANSDGGEIAIGIDDDRGAQGPGTARWKGRSSIEDFNQHIQSLMEITPSLPFSFTFFASVGLPGLVLFVQIDKSAFVHKTSDGRVYIRKSAQSLPLQTDRILELTYAKGATSFEDQSVTSARIEDIVDGKEIQRFLADYSPATDPIDFSLNQHLVDVKSWEPKVAGVLLFANSPSALMPKQCAIKIARYETKEDEPEREHLKEIVSIEGPLYEQIHQTISKLQEIMSSVAIWTAEGLRTVQYPPEAVWEIIVNAVIHRDYSISDNIHIHVYNNRIEVLSPGKLPGYVTLSNILESRYSRNPKIVRALSRYKEPPNKDMGEGLNTAFQKMKEWKLKNPVIREDGNYVQVTIPHSPMATPEEAVLEFLQNNPTIRNSQAREITGIRSENEVKRVFLRLTKDERIERVPGLRGSASLWRLKKQGKSQRN
jgi:ATP-dependent DNA helicase RecG